MDEFAYVFGDIKTKCGVTTVEIAVYLKLTDQQVQRVRDWEDPKKHTLPIEPQVHQLIELFRRKPGFTDEDAKRLLKAAGYSTKRAAPPDPRPTNDDALLHQVEQQQKILNEIMRALETNRGQPDKLLEKLDRILEEKKDDPATPTIKFLRPEITYADVATMGRDIREVRWLQSQENLFFGVAGVLAGSFLGILIQLASSSAPPLIILGVLLLTGTILLGWHLRNVRQRIDGIEDDIGQKIESAKSASEVP